MGVKRFVELVTDEFFDDQILYRIIPEFIVQFGVAADPQTQKKWQDKTIPDERQRNMKFKHGTVSFAGTGQKNSRSCHIFIACEPNGSTLGNAPHETPIGQVIVGIEVLDKLQENYNATGYPENLDIQQKL